MASNIQKSHSGHRLIIPKKQQPLLLAGTEDYTSEEDLAAEYRDSREQVKNSKKGSQRGGTDSAQHRTIDSENTAIGKKRKSY